MMATLLKWIRGEHETGAEPCDPLQELVEVARASEQEAWEAVNESRRRRGEPPVSGNGQRGTFPIADFVRREGRG